MRSRLALIFGGAVVVGAVVVWHVFRADDSFAQVNSGESRLALALDDPRSLTEIERNGGPDVYYHVVLTNVPSWKKLPLRCDWLDPEGRALRANRYRTHLTDKTDWPTHCHQRFSSADTAGAWTVNLSLADRVIASTHFTLR